MSHSDWSICSPVYSLHGSSVSIHQQWNEGEWAALPSLSQAKAGIGTKNTDTMSKLDIGILSLILPSKVKFFWDVICQSLLIFPARIGLIWKALDALMRAISERLATDYHWGIWKTSLRETSKMGDCLPSRSFLEVERLNNNFLVALSGFLSFGSFVHGGGRTLGRTQMRPERTGSGWLSVQMCSLIAQGLGFYPKDQASDPAA